MWNFLDEESAHYFQFFNHLKEKKTFFESSFLKKAEKTAFESQIIKKILMALLGFRIFLNSVNGILYIIEIFHSHYPQLVSIIV